MGGSRQGNVGVAGMNAIIIKFPRSARFCTKAKQAQLNKVFKRIKSDEPERSDKKALKLAMLFIRLEERCAQLHKERGSAPARALDVETLATAAAAAVRTAKATTARRRT